VAASAAQSITADPVAWFTAERLSLLAVIERCCADGGHPAAARLAASMASFQHLQGRPDDAERAWQAIAAAAQHARDPAAAVGARLRLAVAACGQGRHAEASPIVDQCVSVFGELGDQRALGTPGTGALSANGTWELTPTPGNPHSTPSGWPRTPVITKLRPWPCAC
jgi:hypothetical protein